MVLKMTETAFYWLSVVILGTLIVLSVSAGMWCLISAMYLLISSSRVKGKVVALPQSPWRYLFLSAFNLFPACHFLINFERTTRTFEEHPVGSLVFMLSLVILAYFMYKHKIFE